MSQTNARLQGGGMILPQGSSPGNINVGEQALILDSDGTPKLQRSDGTKNAIGGACDFNSAAPAATRVVRFVATSNITLSGNQALDSGTTVDGDRVLSAGQTTQSENGIWIAGAGAWTRATDWNDGSQMSAGTPIYVSEGLVFGGSLWRLRNSGAIVIGTTSLRFTPGGANFDPNPGIGVSTSAQIGVTELRLQNPGVAGTVASFRAFGAVALLNPPSAGVYLGGVGYRALAGTTEWASIQGAHGKMTGIPLGLGTGGDGHWVPCPDMDNFKFYAFDGQTGGTWKCYGEAYTALKRGTNLTDANQTIQPFTDKASRYDRVIALTANRNTTLGTTSVVTGTKVTLVRHDSAAFTNAIINGGGGAGTLLTFAASPTEVQRATFRYDGTNWALVDFEYVEA